MFEHAHYIKLEDRSARRAGLEIAPDLASPVIRHSLYRCSKYHLIDPLFRLQPGFT